MISLLEQTVNFHGVTLQEASSGRKGKLSKAVPTLSPEFLLSQGNAYLKNYYRPQECNVLPFILCYKCSEKLLLLLQGRDETRIFRRLSRRLRGE